MQNRLIAECFGTFWLVLGGCGAAVLAGSGIGPLGVAIAFGLSLMAMAYVIGPISGCHINPAVTLGMWANGRIDGRDVLPYIASQCVGAVLGAGILYLVASGKAGFDVTNGFASNGFDQHSPGGYGLRAAFLCELVLTFGFMTVILGATHNNTPAGFAPIAIGLCLTLVHLISIPVTNTSVNPARSLGPAIFEGHWAMGQLWLFWVAPIAGAVLAGLFFRHVLKR